MAKLRKTAAVLASGPEWITIGTLSGEGNGTSTITAAAFTGRESRSGVITAETTGGASDTCSVVQTGKPEHITIETVTYSVSASGGAVEITGTSNSAALSLYGSTRIDGATYKLTVNETEDESWDGDSNITVNGDPGAEAEYTFKITVTYPANDSASARTDEFVVQNSTEDVQSEEITVTQAAGERTYSDVTILSFTYPVISAAGNTVTPTVTYSQTWGWNGSTTGGGTITSGGTLSFTGTGVNAETGAVIAESKGTEESDVTTVTTATVTVSMNGKTATQTATVTQAANAITNYGDVIIEGGEVSDIPAAGGSVSSATGITASQTITYTSGDSRNGNVEITYSTAVSATSLGTTVKSRSLVGTLTATATGEGEKSATKDFEIYQAANAITEYGNVTLGLTTPVSLAASGETYDLGAQVDAKFSQTITYTSTATSKGEITLEYYSVTTPSEGFSLNANDGTVTVTENPETSTRGGFVVEVTITGESDKSVTEYVTFNQQGSDSEIDLSPDSIEFEYTGGTKTLTITSNDSWTLS